MNEEQTRKFADTWNRRHGFPIGEDTMTENMRYVSPGIVTWNAYDAPDVDVVEFVGIATGELT